MIFGRFAYWWYEWEISFHDEKILQGGRHGHFVLETSWHSYYGDDEKILFFLLPPLRLPSSVVHMDSWGPYLTLTRESANFPRAYAGSLPSD